jgi:transposase-like protein
MKQCPMCGSWEATRQVQGFRVFFRCRKCNHQFN